MCVIYNDGPGSQTFCDTCSECTSLRDILRADFEESGIPLEHINFQASMKIDDEGRISFL